MKEIPAPDGMVCHLLRRDGAIAGEGGAVAYKQAGQTLEWFASFAIRETSELDLWRRQRIAIDLESEANGMKSETEYPGKRFDAERWLALHGIEDNATLPATGYTYLRAEVNACGDTPFAAATKIAAAVEADGARVQARIEKREKARAIAALPE